MRARFIVWDTTKPRHPVVAQSLDVEVPEGTPEEGNIRIPGTNFAVGIVFLRDADPPTVSTGHLNDLAAECFANSLNHGFWGASTNVGEKIALIHSEVSEALEEYRVNGDLTHTYLRESDGKPEGFAMELADVIIRIADLAGYAGLDLDGAVRRKMDFNETRPHLHGKRL